MIQRFITWLTFSAVVIALLALFAQAAMARQVGVKAEPNKAPAKKNAPPIKPTKPPVTTRPPARAPLVVPTYPVLSRIEKYKAPAFPRSGGMIDRETYDYRIRSREPVPATLTDVLVCDIWQRMTMDLKLSPNPKAVSEETVRRAMNVYLTKRWNDIAGYRPWTHSNFIRGLNESERQALAKDVARYIAENGVRDVKQ